MIPQLIAFVYPRCSPNCTGGFILSSHVTVHTQVYFRRGPKDSNRKQTPSKVPVQAPLGSLGKFEAAPHSPTPMKSMAAYMYWTRPSS